MPFQKKDLAGQHYHWAGSTDIPIFTGAPSRRLFDRYNGEQVLFIINCYGSQTQAVTPEEGRSIEELISSQLPMEAKSEISVVNWLHNTLLMPNGN